MTLSKGQIWTIVGVLIGVPSATFVVWDRLDGHIHGVAAAEVSKEVSPVQQQLKASYDQSLDVDIQVLELRLEYWEKHPDKADPDLVETTEAILRLKKCERRNRQRVDLQGNGAVLEVCQE